MFYAAERGGPVLRVERYSYRNEELLSCDANGRVVRIKATIVGLLPELWLVEMTP